jgi:hypothetical protein
MTSRYFIDRRRSRPSGRGRAKVIIHRALLASALATGCTGGGEGGADVVASIAIEEIACARVDVHAIAATGSVNVLLLEPDMTFHVLVNASGFPSAISSTTTTTLGCGAWQNEGNACFRTQGAPNRQTVTFDVTAMVDFGELPPDVTITINGFATQVAVSRTFAETFGDAACQ